VYLKFTGKDKGSWKIGSSVFCYKNGDAFPMGKVIAIHEKEVSVGIRFVFTAEIELAYWGEALKMADGCEKLFENAGQKIWVDIDPECPEIAEVRSIC